jgi:hypothetical protein
MMTFHYLFGSHPRSPSRRREPRRGGEQMTSQRHLRSGTAFNPVALVAN